MSRVLVTLLFVCLGQLSVVQLRAAELSDPTRPADFLEVPINAESDGQSFTPPRLQAVFRGPGGPSALLDGQSVRVGDELDAGRVEEIGRNYLVLRRGDQQLRLQMLPLKVKQPAKPAGGGDR